MFLNKDIAYIEKPNRIYSLNFIVADCFYRIIFTSINLFNLFYVKYSLIYQDILQLTVFCFYHRYFCVQYNYYFKNYLLLPAYNNFLLLSHTLKDS